MAIEPNQPDSIDTVLAALRSAAPPEGMEARITQCLQHASTSATQNRPRLQSLIAGITPTASWWRGALTGAAFATLLCGALLSFMLWHRSPQLRQNTDAIAAASLPNVSVPGQTIVSTNESSSLNCINRATPSSRARLAAVAEIPSNSSDASLSSLTSQERALLVLARLPNAAALAPPTAEERTHQEAEEQAGFTKFFAPPPPLPSQQLQTPSAVETQAITE